MRCPECGAEGDGNYCARCGTPLGGEERRCPECGSDVEAEARYCTHCGATVEGGPSKPWTAYLPWALSGLALVVFAVAITLFIQGQTEPRRPGSPPTGSVIRGEEGRGGGGTGGRDGGGAAGAMPSASELQDMDPRTAADRLFDRTMRLKEGGNQERARFFARMGRRAYSQVPAARMDADARFHVGLLALVQGDSAAARDAARTVLEGDPDHLLGLLLGARAAGEESRRREYRRRFVEARADADLESAPEYAAHRALIESAAAEFRP